MSTSAFGKGLVIAGLALGALVWIGSKAGDRSTPHWTYSSSGATTTDALHPFYNLKNVSWRKGGFGSVAVVSGEIVNTGTAAGINPTLTCYTYAGNGTKLNELSKTIYATIRSDGSHRFSEISMGFINQQSASLDCQVE